MRSRVYEEASEWLVELRVGELDSAARARLDAWFRTSPEHIRAFLELSLIWEEGGDPELDRMHDTDTLIARARAATNVVPIIAEGSDLRHSRSVVRRPFRFSLRSAFAAAAGILVIGSLIALYVRDSSMYETGTGEQSSVRLSDGSTIHLNSRSRVRVRFSKHARDVDLLEGQAMFHVAKDASRPFVVQSDSTRVRAVGTQFDVYRKASGTIVTVIEGRVSVLPLRAAPLRSPREAIATAPEPGLDTLLLSAGQQVTVTPIAVTAGSTANVASATAWTQRELIFDSTPLGDVAEEFNRHNDRQLVVDDAALHDFHVTGVFSSTDPGSLLRFLRAQPGIRVEETDQAIRISAVHD